MRMLTLRQCRCSRKPAQVLGMRRVTNGFDARKLCDRRRYEYIAPAFVFDPTACRERQWYYAEANAQRAAASAAAAAAAAAVGSTGKAKGAGPHEAGAAAAMPVQDAEAAAPPGRGAAVADDADEKADALLADVTDVSGQADVPQGNGASAIALHEEMSAGGSVANGSHAEQAAAEPSRAKDEPDEFSHPAPGSSSDMGSPDFKFDQACAERLSAILQQYEGTHSFHNFTVKVPVGSPEARRFIVRFRCEGTFELEVSR